MEDGEFYQEAGYDLDNEADYEEENEDRAVEGEIETTGSRVVADDSGVHFAPSPAKRAGGGREALNRGMSSTRARSFVIQRADFNLSESNS